MLTLYRRHKKACEHRGEGREYRRCRCPLWVNGFLGGKDVRRSLATDNWEKAHETVRSWEADRRRAATEKGDAISIEAAENEFLADCEARKLKKSTVSRHRILFRELNAFAVKEGFRFLKQLDVPALDRFRTTWKGESGLTDLKKLERLRSFFKFALARGRVLQNPAAAIRNPKIRPNPTLPFSQEEMLRILAEAAKKITEATPAARNKARRLRALVLLLRYAGLRISDAVGCGIDRLQNAHPLMSV